MSEPFPPVDPDCKPEARNFTLQPRPSLLRFLTEHNPFYLISAACMLASCLALTNSLSWTSISRTRLLTLIVTLNVYEAALLAIALFLVTRRKLRRDGRILLLLQAFFLADFSFLNAEIATQDVTTGIAVNACLLVLAAVKMGVVIRVLRPSFTASQFGLAIAQLAVLFGTPIALRWIDANRGILNERQFFVVWWVIGLLPAFYEIISRLDRERLVRLSTDAQAAPTTAYLSIPFVSLLVHVGILHWVYRVDYVAAHAAPMLLALALMLNRFTPTALVPHKDLVFLRVVLPAVAVMVSWNSPIAFPLGLRYPALVVTPANLAIAGAFGVYVYSFLMPYVRIVLSAGATLAAAYVLGPTWQQVITTIVSGWDKTASLVHRMTPKTVGEWGLAGLVASFAFLGLGFCMSLRKQPDWEQDLQSDSD